MALSRMLDVFVAGVFGLFAASGTAMAANSQAHKVLSAVVTLVKGGNTKNHTQNGTDAAADAAARPKDDSAAANASDQFAAADQGARSPTVGH